MSNNVNNSKQYEASQLNEQNKKELLRALFDSYKNRVLTGLGFTNPFETVMNDRLMSFKNISKKELEVNFFTSFFFIIIAYVMFLNSIKLNTSFFFLIAFFVGYFISNYRIFLLRNISPLRNKLEKIAFKKVMYDVYFETLTSVQLIYYVFVICIVALYFLLHNYCVVSTFNTIDLGILDGTSKLNLVPFNFYYFLDDILISCFSYLLGSYLYLFTDIFIEIKQIIKKSEKENNDN